MSDRFTLQIKELNKLYGKMNSSLEIMKKFISLNRDLDTYYWRIQKNFDEFNKIVMKELNKQVIDSEFKEITKSLKPKKNKRRM